jgi:hypothetical protein
MGIVRVHLSSCPGRGSRRLYPLRQKAIDHS